MGKSKKGGGGSGGKKGAAAAPKCTCDDPYKCNCGNRPERPSRGHKWDPVAQQWGGKGHKQKGASGQTGAVAQQAKTTAVGKTKVESWQRLPSQLLREICQRQKRSPPKFKNLGSGDNDYKYRCIVPDPKKSENDLFFVPKNGVPNEEQAKEEAALLALLQLTPTIPHELKLPEPYKTTWLNALQQIQQQNNDNNNKKLASANRNNNNNSSDKKPAATSTSRVKDKNNNIINNNNSKAASSSNLELGSSYISLADKRKQQEEKRRKQNARIWRFEAIRNANKNPQVFLSAQLRTQIQKLLRGDDIVDLLLDETDSNNILTDPESDAQAYVEGRLHQEGFTQRQARTAFEKASSSKNSNDWELLYEDCLQWLCVNLEEEQLPEGFDPRGQTLDVLVEGGSKKAKSDSTKSVNNAASPKVVELANKYGISNQDAAFLLDQDNVETAYWNAVCKLAAVDLPQPNPAEFDKTTNMQTLQDEKEALDAIFPSACKVLQENNDQTTVIINTPEELTIKVVVTNGDYPFIFPEQIIITGNWPSKIGLNVHVEILKTLILGEPMIFGIYGTMQSLLHEPPDSLEPLSIAPSSSSSSSVVVPSKTNKEPPQNENKRKSTTEHKRIDLKRPRERGVFWSKVPQKTTPAVPFPKLSKALEAARKSLPAAKARDEFLSALKSADKASRVVLVTGDTGCGKTTQIPQFILEESPQDVKIVVAQPRRLAATGVAGRVANERGEDKPGTSSVGYVVRGNSAVCEKTRLLFCTTGVLLRQLQCEGALDCITHIIIDEVHERHLDGDILLGLLKQLLKTNKHLRVVLMSATLDADRFANYWGKNTPRIHIPGRTFPVEDYFLDNVLEFTGYIPPKKRKNNRGHSKNNFGGQQQQQQQKSRKSTPWDDSEMSDDEANNEQPVDDDNDDNDDNNESKDDNNDSNNKTILIEPNKHNIPVEDLLSRVDESNIDYDLLGHLIRYLLRTNQMGHDGSILVFLPGVPEINQAKNVIERMTRGTNLRLLPLHGGLQPNEQNMVFDPTRNGCTKVILSTNVAETSITIPDCTVVVDTCREKQSSYDPVNRMPLLLEKFASKASLKQRRGRAGRVREGKCYKLISNKSHDKLHEHEQPEIRRCALDQTLLSLMFLGVERGSGTFLETLLDPPSKESIQAAMISLVQLGAANRDDNEFILTPLGMHLAGIPAPPIIGKMLIMGSILGCRRPALAMAAAISAGRSPFLRIDKKFSKNNPKSDSIQDDKNEIILQNRAELFKKVGNSDHAMLAAVYMDWDDLPTGGGRRKQYCESLGLSFNGMKDIAKLVTQLDQSLSSAGYTNNSKSTNCNAHYWRILRTCAVSAMSPGQLVRVQRPPVKYQSTAEGAVEKDGIAKELKFYIRLQGTDLENNSSETRQQQQQQQSGIQEQRVFIHPSSENFAVGEYGFPWLVYNSLVRTSKAFLRDVTECSSYSLLLFGGPLEVQSRNKIITIDKWANLSANARIGALIGGLRDKLDELLEQKINDSSIDISDSVVMKLIVKLLVTDGL